MKYKLLDYMDMNDDTRTALANYLSITYQTLSNKLNGRVDFTLTELIKIKARYKLTDEQMGHIFFNKEIINEKLVD